MKKSTIAEMVLHSIMCALFLYMAIVVRFEHVGEAVFLAFMSGASAVLVFTDWLRYWLDEAVRLMQENRAELDYIITGSREN